MSLFKNIARAKQLIDFSGLNVKGTKIYPTDTDYYMELWDQGCVLGEFKYNNKPIEKGQYLCLSRHVKTYTMAGKFAIGFIADHYIKDPEDMVPADECYVRAYCYTGQSLNEKGEYNLEPPKKPMTVKELQDWFVRECRYRRRVSLD